MATYAAGDFQPRLGMDVFFSSKQQLRLSMQWAAIRAEEQDFYLIPEGGGRLSRISDPVAAGIVSSTNGDFALSRLTTQLRYRWEIGPLSDFFGIYEVAICLDVSTMNTMTYFRMRSASPSSIRLLRLRYRFGN